MNVADRPWTVVDLADEEARAVDEVVAGVDRDPAAGQVPAESPHQWDVRIGGVVEHERGAQAADLAERPGHDELADLAHRRRPAIAGGQAVEHARRLTGAEQLGSLVSRHAERLLAHDVLAGRCGAEDDRLVRAGGRQATTRSTSSASTSERQSSATRS